VTLLRPERVGDVSVAEELRAFAPDLGVVVAFGQFLPKRIRELPALGYLINAHASLLPRYRGAAPIPHAILNGETETGISVMRIEREMDAGPVALVRRTTIGEHEDAGALAERLAMLAADAVQDALQRIAEGRVIWTPQDHSRASSAPKLEPQDAELAFREPAEALARRVRALAPRPGAFTTWKEERLRILEARALPGPCDDPPGTARCQEEPPLRIATGKGWLVPLRLQRAGARALEAASFLRGHPIPDGACVGEPTPTARLDD
jgi:methionyl-tRNA formyltransferase